MADIRRLEPLQHVVGTDGTISINLYDSAGAALSVTGKTAKWVVYQAVPRRKRKPFTGNALLTKTSAAGEITLASGLATVTIADTDLDLKSGAFWHEIKITDSGGSIAHLGQGELFLRAAV